MEWGMTNCFIDSFALRPKCMRALPRAPDCSIASCTRSRVVRYDDDVRK